MQFGRFGEFHEEHYSIAAIERHLQTPQQRQAIFAAHLSIEKMLNGRYGDEPLVPRIYDEWNKKLGYIMFGSDGRLQGKPYGTTV